MYRQQQWQAYSQLERATKPPEPGRQTIQAFSETRAWALWTSRKPERLRQQEHADDCQAKADGHKDDSAEDLFAMRSLEPPRGWLLRAKAATNVAAIAARYRDGVSSLPGVSRPKSRGLPPLHSRMQ